MHPKAVLFDWDNTLVDTWPIVRDALNHTLVTFGLKPYSDEEFLKRPQTSHRQTFPQLFGDQWEQAEKLYYTLYKMVQEQYLRGFPGSDDFIRHLAQNNVYMAIVSNKNSLYLRQEVELLGWNPYFKSIVGSYDAQEDKPSNLPVLQALKGSGIKPDLQVWFVGDSDVDLECARNSGCQPVMIKHNQEKKPFNEDVLWFHHFDELIDHFNIINIRQEKLR